MPATTIRGLKSKFEHLLKQLVRHEGRRKTVYLDTKGIPTIGIGRNLRDRGLRDDEIDFLFQHDLEDHWLPLIKAHPWIAQLDEVRQAVLLDMSFMGVEKLLKFHNMLAAFKAGRWDDAASHLLNSLYAEQVGKKPGQRAHTLAEMTRTGVSPFA